MKPGHHLGRHHQLVAVRLVDGKLQVLDAGVYSSPTDALDLYVGPAYLPVFLGSISAVKDAVLP